MNSQIALSLTDRLKPLAAAFASNHSEKFEFKSVEWSDGVASATGTSGAANFLTTLNFKKHPLLIKTGCSLCGTERSCPHVRAMVNLFLDYELAEPIEQNDYVDCSFTFTKEKKADPWRSQLGNLTQRLGYVSPHEPASARFPSGRQVIYVIEPERYSRSENALKIRVITQPAPRLDSARSGPKPAGYFGNHFRQFSNGARGLGLSDDPLDREIAERISLTSDANSYYTNRSELQFALPLDTPSDLLTRLARSNRLFFNLNHNFCDGMLQISWLSDERFDLKFQIHSSGEKHLGLGLCAINSESRIRHEELKIGSTWYFIDAKNRLGLFKRAAPIDLFNIIQSTQPIRVPLNHSKDLIQKVMSLPAGLGIEYIDCDKIRPRQVAGTPRPCIHIKAPTPDFATLYAKVQFDYDGVMVPLDRRVAEFFDNRNGNVIQTDLDFHDRSLELVRSLGAKSRPSNGDFTLAIGRKKLPAIVGHLIHQGWHVEADGKLYRNGSKFNLSVVSGIDWFELQGKAHFDQTSIDLPRLIQSLQAGEKTVVLDDGTIGIIPEQWIKQFGGLSKLATTEDGSVKFGASQVGLLDALLAEQGEINVDEKFAAARQSLRAFDRIEPQEPPTGFVGSLRPYQMLAQGWFEFLRSLGFGGCLADDMGLGKTIQVLALLESRRQLNSGPSLIVVPRSLIFNWIAEARKFAPKLRVLDQSHSQRQRGTEHLSDYDLVLTTYGTLRRDAAFLKDFEFDYVVLDEAQAIKNSTTEAAKAARLLRGRHRLALSGTPIENHLGELWSLFDFLNPGMLGRVGRFSGMAQEADADQAKFLAAAVRPFILRRTKKQVAPELPERVEQTVVVELDAEQRKAYDELRDYYRKMLLTKIDTDGIGKSQMVILEALLRLRQAACHPGLVDKARVNDPSAKLDELLSRLTNATESGERVLVFSQFTSLLAIVKLRLKQAKIDFLYLDGKTRDRQSLVDQFQSGTGPGVFLISLKAGGVGLNLTAARTVYLLDPWWNPAVEAQAIDRTHRIGQQQTVFATRLIAADTVEQKVLELQAKKKGLADAIVNADNAGISSLTREDLELLLA
jgi:superfamily II DNA or RNA helicase